jgi:hypothetical protein
MARSGEHYMPRPDGNFAAWANHCYEAVKAFYDEQGFDPDLLTPPKMALETWNALYPAHVRDILPSPTPAPTSRPLALVESGQPLTHQLRLVDESTPTRRARPADVQRAEVFVALTPPGQSAPADPRKYRYIGNVSRGETTLSCESDKGGMQAHYFSRWVSTSGATGPWSETASATVAA